LQAKMYSVIASAFVANSDY